MRASPSTTTTTTILSLAALLLGHHRLPAASVVVASCVLTNCLFDCCDEFGNAVLPLCVANGDSGCPSDCYNPGPGCVSDTDPIALGVKFATSKDICVTGIQFYQEDPSQTFTTTLWNAPTQALLRNQVVPPGSGWQTTTFSPVPMFAGNEFVAAYTAPSGAYAYQYYFFNSDVHKGPVTFKGGVNGNGVFGPPYSFPGLGHPPFRNSNYFVTPIWLPAWSYYVWDPATDTQVAEMYDGYVGCIHVPYNLEARPNCQSPAAVSFKLYNLSAKTVVIRTNEADAPYYVWMNLGMDVLPNRKPLPDSVYQLFTTVGTKTEIITFKQDCSSPST